MTVFNPLIPAKAGTQFLREPECVGQGVCELVGTDRPKHWVPAFAGMSGVFVMAPA